MAKIFSLVFAAALTIVAASFWLKPGVSETAASTRPNPAAMVSLSELHRNADVKSMPIQNVDDKSFVFTDPQ